VVTTIHGQIQSTIHAIGIGGALAAACGGDKSNTGETDSGATIPIPSTGMLPTSTTEPTVSTLEDLPPCTTEPGCYCWAEYTGQYIDYDFTCHEDCVADHHTPNSNWTIAVCGGDSSCCTEGAKCDEIYGVCIPPADVGTGGTTFDTSMTGSDTGSSGTGSSEATGMGSSETGSTGMGSTGTDSSG